MDEDSAQVKALRKKVQTLGKKYFELEAKIADESKTPQEPETKQEDEDIVLKKTAMDPTILHEFEENPDHDDSGITHAPLQPGEENLAGLFWIIEALRSNTTIRVLEVREVRALCENAEKISQWCANVLRENTTLCDLWLGHRVLKVQELVRGVRVRIISLPS